MENSFLGLALCCSLCGLAASRSDVSFFSSVSTDGTVLFGLQSMLCFPVAKSPSVRCLFRRTDRLPPALRFCPRGRPEALGKGSLPFGVFSIAEFSSDLASAHAFQTARGSVFWG
jgi:hypothetical protein